jgi:hypothetical protein
MAELRGTSCSHLWGHPPAAGATPLICLECGELWPGAPLPKSPNTREPAKADSYVPWGQRVAAMVAELHDLESTR